VLNQFFYRWCLQLNPGKTEMCVFQHNTHAAIKQLDVMFNGNFNHKHVDHPKYLGVTLDQTLTFKSHLEKAAKKVSSQVNLELNVLKKNYATKYSKSNEKNKSLIMFLIVFV
jgi:hypothetical protein